jgi:ral guanine nucleotide dissociation stimulator
MSESDIAKSLLAYDVRLFRRVIPWQCLGSVWSRRGTGAEISTVKATVKQFNHVVYIVLATVLSPCLSLAQRAKIVEKVRLNSCDFIFFLDFAKIASA